MLDQIMQVYHLGPVITEGAPTELVTNAKVASTTNTTAELTWNKANNCDGYILYRYNSSIKKWIRLGKISNDNTSYIVTGLEPGNKYTFAIKTVNNSEDKEYGCAKYVKVSGITKLNSIDGLTSTSTKSSINLTWNKAEDAKGYIVYEYNPSTQKWQKYQNVTETSITIDGLSAGTKKKYGVKSYKYLGKTKVVSNSLTKIKTATKPSKVNFNLKSTSKKSVTVTWNKVKGATNYVVYYKTSATGKWKKLKSTTATSYTKTGLKSGKKYYFTVKAQKKYGGITYNGKYTTKKIKVK